MTRRFLVLIHRYAGLTMALFLIVAGLTGSVLVFCNELDDWLNPEGSRAHARVAVQTRPLLDPFDLRDRALALVPHARINEVVLESKPGEAFTASLEPCIDPATGHPYRLTFDTLKLNPYTGQEVDRTVLLHNQEDFFPLSRSNIIRFVYALHERLALGEIGGWALGITALIWAVDCFVGFYLTLPTRRKRPAEPLLVVEPTIKRGFCSRWKPSWLVKLRASAFRFNFDLHRAFGLWTWLMLFIFAWSSVMFNLPQVYNPVMSLLFEMPPEQNPMPMLSVPRTEPAIDFRTAHAIGQRLMAEQARLHGFKVISEWLLRYDPSTGLFSYDVEGDDIFAKEQSTGIVFDANNAKVIGLHFHSNRYLGASLGAWLSILHTAKIGGRPYQILVCFMGLVITMLSVTGIYIWLKKHRVAKSKPSKSLTEARIKIQP